MSLKKSATILLTGIAVVFGAFVVLVALSMQQTHAKGAVAARAAVVSTSRSTSAPVSRTSYTSSSRPAAKKKSLISSYAKRDDDVECSTLRNSRYAADREVYRRYC